MVNALCRLHRGHGWNRKLRPTGYPFLTTKSPSEPTGKGSGLIGVGEVLLAPTALAQVLEGVGTATILRYGGRSGNRL